MEELFSQIAAVGAVFLLMQSALNLTFVMFYPKNKDIKDKKSRLVFCLIDSVKTCMIMTYTLM